MWEVITGFELAFFLAFVGTGLLLNLTLGAHFVIGWASGINAGPRAGMAATIGVSLGILFHVALAAARLTTRLVWDR